MPLTEVCPVNATHRVLYCAAYHVVACLADDAWLDATCAHEGCRWCARRPALPSGVALADGTLRQNLELTPGAREAYNAKHYARMTCATCALVPEHQAPSATASCGHPFGGMTRAPFNDGGNPRGVDTIRG